MNGDGEQLLDCVSESVLIDFSMDLLAAVGKNRERLRKSRVEEETYQSYPRKNRTSSSSSKAVGSKRLHVPKGKQVVSNNNKKKNNNSNKNH